MRSAGAAAAGLRPVDPLAERGYDELLATHREGHFFHTSSWARVLHSTYGYEPRYFARCEGGDLAALVALMDVKSVITGHRGVSLPFTDFCQPLAGGGLAVGDLLSFVQAYAAEAGWSYAEIRPAQDCACEAPASKVFYRHTLSLEGGEAAVYARVKSSTRRNIGKARKSGVDILSDGSPDAMAHFYRLNCLTRKRHGLPPQPRRLFRNIFEHVLRKGWGRVILAWHGEECVAGALFLHFNGVATYKYGVSDIRWQGLRANNLVMWEAIRTYAEEGYHTFCFGRTETANHGLLQFKRGWGGEERRIGYLRYYPGRKAFARGEEQGEPIYAKVLRRTPLPLLRILGSVLYRHVA